MPGGDLVCARVLDEKGGVENQNVRADQILDRVEDARNADEIGRPFFTHMKLAVLPRFERRTPLCSLVVFEAIAIVERLCLG